MYIENSVADTAVGSLLIGSDEAKVLLLHFMQEPFI